MTVTTHNIAYPANISFWWFSTFWAVIGEVLKQSEMVRANTRGEYPDLR
jgi:hypothetical protein